MILIILPNQLFPINLIKKLMPNLIQIIILEEPRYFTDYNFHKLKLVYHRASMKKYHANIFKQKIDSIYYDFNKITDKLYTTFNNRHTYFFNPIDHILLSKYNKLLPNANMIDNLNFLLTPDEVFKSKHIFYKNNKYHHGMFYKFQRMRLNILVKGSKPVGNKWSYDDANRQSLPSNIKIPPLPKTNKDIYYREAVEYINKHFETNYGDIDNWIYPIDTQSAIKFLKHFMLKKLYNFGPYQDAVDSSNPFLFHSVLSPMMNIGIITDHIVVDMVNKYYLTHKKIPIESYEGFIRQIIGWRNYVYSIYLLEPKLYMSNYFSHTEPIGDNYWLGTTNIDPIDSIICDIVKYSYAHHIQRLMFLGNWFLINQKDPKEVHRIFMEWTIDAYDWVMVPNVMGMSQYADGGKMMSRIYFSSSNYISKMSDFNQNANKDWWKIWDAKYYNFINQYQNILKKNYATSRQVAHWLNKTPTEKKRLLEIANRTDY
jgi:deoxyribodipyrimidine photolyase-related protein